MSYVNSLRRTLCLCVCLPHVTDERMLQFLLFQQIAQVSSNTQGISSEILFLNHIQHGQTDGTWHRVTTKLRKDRNPKAQVRFTWLASSSQRCAFTFINHNFSCVLIVMILPCWSTPSQTWGRPLLPLWWWPRTTLGGRCRWAFPW